MKTSTFSLLSAAVLAGAFVVQPAAASTEIYNYSFEDSNVPGSSYSSYYYAPGFTNYSGDGSTAVVDAGVTFGGLSGVQSNGSAWNFQAAPDGTHTAFIQSYSGSPASPGSITLDLSNLQSGKQYLVSFSYASRPNYTPDAFSVSGVVSASITPVTTAWTTDSLRFTASGADSLTFTAAVQTGFSPDSSVGLDHVTVSAVPEASTWAMLLVGFVGLGFAARFGAKGKAEAAVSA